MPNPTSGTTIQRPDLQPGLDEYVDDQNAFIGLQVAPLIEVAQRAADYPIIPLEALLSIPETKRALRGHYQRSDWEFETDTYSCVENGFEEVIDEVEEALYSRFMDVEQVCTNRAMGVVLRRQEKRIADMVFNDSNFTPTSPTHEWDDATNAVPLTDIKTAHIKIKDATGMMANTLIISWSTYLDLGINTQILSRIKYTNPAVTRGQLSLALLAQAFEVDKILVGGGRYNTAKKGQTASLSNLWSNEYAMLCITNDSPDITTPCLARTFLWTGDSPSNSVVETYHEDQSRGDVVRVRHNTDEEFIIAACGELLDNITT